MCLSAPVEVLAVDGARARVRSGDAQLTVATLGLPDLRAGDWALLSGGVLVRRIEPDRAREIAAAVAAAGGGR